MCIFLKFFSFFLEIYPSDDFFNDARIMNEHIKTRAVHMPERVFYSERERFITQELSL